MFNEVCLWSNGQFVACRFPDMVTSPSIVDSTAFWRTETRLSHAKFPNHCRKEPSAALKCIWSNNMVHWYIKSSFFRVLPRSLQTSFFSKMFCDGIIVGSTLLQALAAHKQTPRGCWWGWTYQTYWVSLKFNTTPETVEFFENLEDLLERFSLMMALMLMQRDSKQPKDTLKKNSRQVFDNGFVLFLFPCPLKTTSFTKKKSRSPWKNPTNSPCQTSETNFLDVGRFWSFTALLEKTQLCGNHARGFSSSFVYVKNRYGKRGKTTYAAYSQPATYLVSASKQGNSHKNDGAVAHLCPHRSKCKSSQSPNVLAMVLCHSGRDPLWDHEWSRSLWYGSDLGDDWLESICTSYGSC